MDKRKLIFWMLVILVFVMAPLTACGTANLPEDVQPAEDHAPSEAETTEPESTVTEEKQEDVSAGQPPDPQPVQFTAADSEPLEGFFYPAEDDDAPLVMLYHWAPGDQMEWTEIAYWLQNRGLGGQGNSNAQKPWLNPAWFPSNPDSFHVFTFTFRNCIGGCKAFERERWYLDVQGAVDYTQTLPYSGKRSIVMVGASIGADGAADGCAYANQTYPGICKGAFSLSPGNYLTLDYSEKVQEMDPVPAWCLYAETDPESAAVCGAFEAENYRPISYPGKAVFGNGHGMNLVEPELEPNSLVLLLEFIATALE